MCRDMQAYEQGNEGHVAGAKCVCVRACVSLSLSLCLCLFMCVSWYMRAGRWRRK